PLKDTTQILVIGDTTTNPGVPVRYTVIGGRSFIWEPGEYFDCPTCSSVLVTVEEDAEFRLTVLDSFGCPHEFRFRIHLQQPACDSSTIYIPNAFSPNQDGRNDMLYVRSKSITQMHLLIYDRWGERVFESFHPDDGWDGRFKGKPLGPDVFGYVLKALCVGGQEYQIKGNITLLK
ncbi:MAG TPA: gliding motility-associated C-terminal domain-containing protein, partial [Saprospiraceae bacterium]|nr:gliding motility-associated C-terminal domain-containing protein [Saprospiraceae bacterium]